MICTKIKWQDVEFPSIWPTKKFKEIKKEKRKKERNILASLFFFFSLSFLTERKLNHVTKGAELFLAALFVVIDIVIVVFELFFFLFFSPFFLC